MNSKKFEEAAKKFEVKINSYKSMIKIERRVRGPADIGGTSKMITFEAIVRGVKIDIFLNESSWNVSNTFIEICEKTAKRVFNQKINWNNTRTIFWIYNEIS